MLCRCDEILDDDEYSFTKKVHNDVEHKLARENLMSRYSFQKKLSCKGDEETNLYEIVLILWVKTFQLK